MLSGAQNASPGSPCFIDCKAVQLGAKNGTGWAAAPARKLARAWVPLSSIIEDSASTVNWMPAHLSKKDVGEALLSDGQPLSENDLQTNSLVDQLAKDEAGKYQPSKADVQLVARTSNLVVCTARWIGQCTVMANSFPIPKQDGKTSRIRDSGALTLKRFGAPRLPQCRRDAKKRPKPSPSVFASVTSVPCFKLSRVSHPPAPSSSSQQSVRIQSFCTSTLPPPKRRRITERQAQLRDDAAFHNYWLDSRGAGRVLSQPCLSGRERLDALRGRLATKGLLL